MSKRKTIDIGVNADNKTFRVPVELVTETSAVLGRRGSGKTHTGVVCAEGLLAQGHQVIILDPLDVWWGLKSSKDGRSDGFDILLLGDSRKPHTDLPLAEGDAEMVADFLVDEQLPCILSMRHLSKAARKRFAARFAERIYDRKGDPGRNTPCLFIVDEAGTFVPQRVTGEDAAMVGAFESWVRQGRASGIGAMLIDQRPATVNKDVLTQVELLIAHQLTSPHDKKPVREWVHEKADDDGAGTQVFWDSLPKLAKGHAWFWSPAWLQCFERVAVGDRTTFDSSATPTAGKAAATPKAMADVDLDALKGKLAQSIERKKETDPKLLKQRVSELERECKSLRGQLEKRPAEVEVKRVEVPAVKDADIKRVEKASADLQAAIDKAVFALQSGKVDAATHRIDAVAENLQLMKDRSNGTGDHRRSDSSRTKPARGRSRETNAVPELSRLEGADTLRSAADGGRPGGNCGDLDGPSQRILNALGWWKAIGIADPTMAQLGFVAGYKPKGGSFNTYLSRLSARGLIDRAHGRVSLTRDGDGMANVPDVAPSLDELHLRIVEQLDGPQSKIINVVLDHGPDADLSRDEIAEATGYKAGGGSFNTYLSRLSTLGLIERNRGLIRPTAVLWPEGLS